MASYKKQFEELLSRQALLEADVSFYKTESAAKGAHLKELENRFADILLKNQQLTTQNSLLEDKIPISTLETENENLRRINQALGKELVQDGDRHYNFYTRLRLWWRYFVVKPKN